MQSAQLRAQTILYKNDLAALERSVISIAAAVRQSRERDGLVKSVEIAFGDASPEPILNNEIIAEWNQKYGEFLTLSYTVFGFNSGTSKGQNILFRECNSPYIMIYNPDIVVSANYFLEMMPLFSRYQNVGMVEARQTPLEHPKSFNLNDGTQVWGAMACVIVPSAIYSELSGLDEQNFFMYCDDVDFSWRLRLSGRRVVYCPSAVVFHGHRLDSKGKTCPTEAELYYSAESSLFMAYKYSCNQRVKELIKQYSVGTPYQQKALSEFMRRKSEGSLPEQLDRNHKIAYFKDGCYSCHRYEM